MRAIVRKDTGESYQEYLERLAKAAGIQAPTAEDCRRMDKKRKGKKTSNKDWESKTDPDARIARLKDGRTRLAYKPEHVVDLDTGAIIAAEVHPADLADTASLEATLETARSNVLSVVERAESETRDDDDPPPPSASTDSHDTDADAGKVGLVTDKGYHKAAQLPRLADAGFRTYIPERRQKGRRRWADKGGSATARAFHANRARVKRKKSKALHRRRGELLERTFAHVCETGAHRRTRLRGLWNMKKRYLIQTAAANLGLVMRSAFGYGTPRELANRVRAAFSFLLLLSAALWRVAHFKPANQPSSGMRPGDSAWSASRRCFSTGC